jgi:hypothetical protein
MTTSVIVSHGSGSTKPAVRAGIVRLAVTRRSIPPRVNHTMRKPQSRRLQPICLPLCPPTDLNPASGSKHSRMTPQVDLDIQHRPQQEGLSFRLLHANLYLRRQCATRRTCTGRGTKSKPPKAGTFVQGMTCYIPYYVRRQPKPAPLLPNPSVEFHIEKRRRSGATRTASAPAQGAWPL